jgi:transposase-like protein
MDTRMTKQRNFPDRFKAALALEALRGGKTVQEITAKRKLHPKHINTWKRQTIEGMAGHLPARNHRSFQSKRIIDNWIGFYNSECPHTALDKRTPDIAYFGHAEIRKAA